MLSGDEDNDLVLLIIRGGEWKDGAYSFKVCCWRFQQKSEERSQRRYVKIDEVTGTQTAISVVNIKKCL